MTCDDLNKEYFDWMCSLAIPNVYLRDQYSKLLESLYISRFYFTIPLDENRYIDGVDLRYRFGYEIGVDKYTIANCLGMKECSMLEMMVALALRCEEQIMSDPDIGDRLGKWFMDMIESLGLSELTDDNFNSEIFDQKIDRFLNREYDPNGKGGLFTINDSKYDMRKAEIWYQMCWYLDGILNIY